MSDEKSNRLANLLLSCGVHKDDRVALLLYNRIEWLPLYFGILETGATAVPLNFHCASDEIEYCFEKSDATILVFGSEFMGRAEAIVPKIKKGRFLFYVGDDCPTWAENYWELAALCTSTNPLIPLSEDEDATIYYSSGMAGFPKAILHHHRSLTQVAATETVRHKTVHEDVFLFTMPVP